MKSLLLVCNLHPKKFGTFEQYLILLGKRCQQQAIRCGLMICGEPIPIIAHGFREAGIESYVVANWNNPQEKEQAKIFTTEYLQILQRGPWDVVVFQFCRETTVARASFLAWLKRLAPTASIWIQHSQMVMPGRISKWLSRIRLLRPFVQGMILLSDSAQQAVTARGWPRHKSIVIRNGIPLHPQARRGWLRAFLELPQTAILLISVGSLIPRKGYDLLIPAVTPHLGGDPEKYLLIVGEGPEKESLEALVKEKQIEPFVRFLGLRNDVPDLLADSDLFVLASRAEGLTLAVVEAMAAGLAVVATDVGGHKEVITPETGFLVPPEDTSALSQAIAKALTNLDHTKQLGQTAQQWANQRFSLDKQVDDQLNYFQTVWQKSGRVSEASASNSAEVGS